MVESLVERTTFARSGGLYDVFSGVFTPIRSVSLTVALTDVSFFPVMLVLDTYPSHCGRR